MMRHKDIYAKTVTVWGEQAQYGQAMEECAELIVALQHYMRGKIGPEDVIRELADVYLMVGQLTYMFGEDQLTSAVEEKLDKLQRLLDGQA